MFKREILETKDTLQGVQHVAPHVAQHAAGLLGDRAKLMGTVPS
jgi:hypothetical protein